MDSHRILSDYLTFTNFASTVLIYLVVAIAASFWRAPRYPTTLPWAGHGKTWRAALSNAFGSIKNTKAWVTDGYTRYGKNGQAFVLPSTLGAPAEIVLPRSQLQWLVDQPDAVLDPNSARYDILHGEYNFVEPIILQDPYHEHVVHKNLARNLNVLIPDINDQVCHEVDDFFGQSTEWRSVNILDAMMRLVPRITNRMLVGQPLCQDKDFLYHSEGYVNNIIRGFILFSLVPRGLHPIVGPISGLSSKYHAWKVSKHSIPIIKQRLVDTANKDSGDPAYKDLEIPNDFITWQIRTARAEGRMEECDPWRITLRFLPLDFASVHTTALTGHSILLDILSCGHEVVDNLREEASRVFHEEGNRWTKKGLARMYRMDSAIRESQRFSSFAITFVQRKVIKKDGLFLPDGTHVAHGTVLSCAWEPVSSDEELHQQADKFDPFRYSREREAYEARSVLERDQAETLKLKQTSIVTTSDKHFPFSHGRHACPGRFFVAHELKMLLAYLFLNYDIKHLAERPQSFWIGRNNVPPSNARMELRRKSSIY